MRQRRKEYERMELEEEEDATLRMIGIGLIDWTGVQYDKIQTFGRIQQKERK